MKIVLLTLAFLVLGGFELFGIAMFVHFLKFTRKTRKQIGDVQQDMAKFYGCTIEEVPARHAAALKADQLKRETDAAELKRAAAEQHENALRLAELQEASRAARFARELAAQENIEDRIYCPTSAELEAAQVEHCNDIGCELCDSRGEPDWEQNEEDE